MEINLFIIGMPRSGTKLLRELLNSSSEIYIPEAESQFFPYLYNKYGDSIDFSNNKIKLNFISDVRKSMFIYYLKQEFGYSTELNFLELKKKKEQLSKVLSELMKEFNKKKDIKYLGEKTPEYLFHTDLLQSKFPQAKFIHIVRDPRDYVLSMKKAWGKNIFLAAYKWNNSILDFQIKKEKLGTRLLEIKYEDLISEPEKTLLDICHFMGISFNKQMLTPNKSVENKGDAKGQNTIKKNNYNKFLKQLSSHALLKIERIVLDGLKTYNYEIVNKGYIRQSKNPHSVILKWYRLKDMFNVFLDAIKVHGIKNGLKKIYYSQKQFASKN